MRYNKPQLLGLLKSGQRHKPPKLLVLEPFGNEILPEVK